MSAFSNFVDEAGVTRLRATGGGGSRVATVNLTSADIKSLNGTPKTLIAAPAAGHIIVPVSVLLDYKFGTVAYTNGSDVYVTTAAAVAGSSESYYKVTAGDLTGAESRLAVGVVRPHLPTRAEVDAQPLIFIADSTEFDTGDGTARLTILYQNVTLS